MEIQKFREDTPGVNNVLHLNNAGAALPPSIVIEKMTDYLEEESLHGGYRIEDESQEELKDLYQEISQLIHSEPTEIAITDSATTSWQRALHSIEWKKGDIIISGNAEYASNFISFIQLKKRFGVEVKIAPDNEFGETDPILLENMLDANVKLISVTHMPTANGLVNPIEEIGNIAKKHGILYLVDACQSAGHYPLNVAEIGCDFLSATGRKYLRGPRGTGFLYINKKVIPDFEPLSIDLHSALWLEEDLYKPRKDARKFETWESNVAGKIGLKEAIKYLNKKVGIENIWKRNQQLGNKLREILGAIKGVDIQDTGRVKSGIVTFTMKDFSAHEVSKMCRKLNINISSGSTRNSLLDLNQRGIQEYIRASAHYYNTEKELEHFGKTIENL